MPSELQRVARGLVDCFDEVPQVVDHLRRTAARCRENAQLALQASHGQAKTAALQLEAAAQACEAAAHYLSMAPPKARGWAEGLIGSGGSVTNRPSSDSADRIKLPGASVDEPERTERRTATFDDVEVAEDNELPLITVARKAAEKWRKRNEKDEEQRDFPEEPLEVELTVAEPDEFEERDQKEDREREERLAHDLEIEVDLRGAVEAVRESMADSEDQKWQEATILITPDRQETTFDGTENGDLEPVGVDFDPGFDPRRLGSEFAPGVFDPDGVFNPRERAIADRLAEEGWRIDPRPADHTKDRVKNPDRMVRKGGDADGVIIEFKTPESRSSNAIKRNIHEASEQTGRSGEILIDGRAVNLSEDVARRSFRRACGQPGGHVANVVHVILGDGRLVTYTKEQ